MGRGLAVLLVLAVVLAPQTLSARETSVYSGTSGRPSSANGGSFLDGNDIRIEADTNCAWVYVQNATKPAFWSNNVSILGTGFDVERGGALRFGEGLATLTYPMIWSGNVTLIGDATIGVQTGTADAVGMITGQLQTESSDYKLLIRAARSAAEASNKPGILVLTSDNSAFTSNIQVGGGTLQLGSISSSTATGYEWVQNGDGTETYRQNTAKVFAFDGSTGSVGSAVIDLTSVHSGTYSTLKFQRSGDVALSNAVTGNGYVVFDGTAKYSIGAGGSLASTLSKVTVNQGATLVNCQHSVRNAANTGNDEGTWDFTNPVSGNGFYQIAFAELANITTGNARKDIASIPVSLSGFTGTCLVSNGFRYQLVTNWNTASKGYSLGAVDYGQIWMQANATYTGDLYLKGNGWSTSEYRGALRFGHKYDNSTDLTALTSMEATYGNLYLLGDTRICPYGDSITVGLIASDISNYGDGNYKLDVNDVVGVASRVIFTGTNSYGATTVNGQTTLQIGHVGTINGKTYDGTTGTVGTGAVTIGSAATLQFKRTNDYALGTGNSIANSGKLIFDGGGNYTLNAALTGSGTTTVAANTKLTTNKGFAGTLSGAGTLQINSPSANAKFTAPALSGFTGTLLAGKDYRWGNPAASNSYSIGAVNGGQLWFTDTTNLTQDVYLEGLGWHSGERYGAVRFATPESGMAQISGNVHLLGDTRISARNAETPGFGLISGNIDGNFDLELNSRGAKAEDLKGTVILTGTNAYAETSVNGGGTLVVGWIGTISGKTFDGTSGTLGTGTATVGATSTLKFMRSGNVALANSFDGTGALLFDGTATYSLGADQIADTLNATIADGATLKLTSGTTAQTFGTTGLLTLAGATLTVPTGSTLSRAVTVAEGGVLEGAGIVSNVTMSGGTISDTLTIDSSAFNLNGTLAMTLDETSKTTADVEFDGTYGITDGSTLSWTYENGFAPEVGDTLFLIAGDAGSFDGVNLSSLVIDAPALASSEYFWNLKLLNYGTGLALAASLGVPEPSTLLLLCFGIIIGAFQIRKRSFFKR